MAEKERRNPLWSAFGLWWLLAFGALASLGSAVAGEQLDPVVAEVAAMLEANVDETNIQQWLESTGRRPADIGSPDMIALTRAGASAELIGLLLESLDSAAVDITAEAAREVPTLHPESPIEARIRLQAKRVWVDEEEPDVSRERAWDVFVYLDGEYVAWTRPSLQGEPVVAFRLLHPNRHELRVVLQRFEERSDGWLYESLAVPTLLAFEAETAEPIDIEIDMRRIWGLWRQREDGGPLSFVIRQGERVLAENSGTGGDPDRWRPVCEDVEANFPPDSNIPRRFRDAMERCVTWAELWTGAGADTSRAEILSWLADYDFEPSVR